MAQRPGVSARLHAAALMSGCSRDHLGLRFNFEAQQRGRP
jgi:hypothetical protein